MPWHVRRVGPLLVALFVRSHALYAAHRRQLWLTVARYEPPSERRLLDANHRRGCHREPPMASRLGTPPVESIREDRNISSDTGQAYFPVACAKTRSVLLRNLLSRLKQPLARPSEWWPVSAHHGPDSRSGHR